MQQARFHLKDPWSNMQKNIARTERERMVEKIDRASKRKRSSIFHWETDTNDVRKKIETVQCQCMAGRIFLLLHVTMKLWKVFP